MKKKQKTHNQFTKNKKYEKSIYDSADYGSLVFTGKLGIQGTPDK